MRRFARSCVQFAGFLGMLAVAACSNDSSSNSATAPSIDPVKSVAVAATTTSLPVQGGTTEVTATVTAANGQPAANFSVTFSGSNGTFSPASVITNASGVAKSTLRTTSSSTVRAQVGIVSSTTLAVNVKQAATLTITLDPEQPTAGDPVKVTVGAKRNGADVSGTLTVAFGDGGSASARIAGQASVEYTYPDSGEFNLQATVEESDGSLNRETLRLSVAAAGRRPFSGGEGDDIDPNAVTYLHTNVANWAITSTITDITITDSQICIDHTMSGRWGSTPFFDIEVEGNPWVFAKFGGRWYAGTYDWLRPGQVCKGVTGPEFGVDQVRIPPMDASWGGPRTGEEVGFMVSTRARDEVRNGEERTNIKVIRWP